MPRVVYTCLSCGETLTGRGKKYCDSKCQGDYEYLCYINRWKRGEEVGYRAGPTAQISNHVRRYLLDKYSFSCCRCGWNTRHPTDGKPLVEVNHIDGNAHNCSEDNL